MSNELKQIVKNIQFKTDKTIEEIAKDLGYTRAYFTNQVNIGTNESLKNLLLDKYKEEIEHNIIREPQVDYIIKDNSGQYHFIEVKTASGKVIKVKPDNLSDMAVLNAFLEERDRVLEERNRVIEKIETQSQAQIDELKKDKEELTHKLNSILERIYGGQQLALAYQKAWVDYEAERASKGDQKKKKEIQYKMGKLVDGIIQNDASKGIPVETDKLRKEG